jgi:cell division protein FtsZ
LDCDLARLRRLLPGGSARLGAGLAYGERAVLRAAAAALCGPPGPPAEGVVVHVTGGDDLAVRDVERAADAAGRAWAPGGSVELGVAELPAWRGAARVVVLATGLGAAAEVLPVPVAAPPAPLREAV